MPNLKRAHVTEIQGTTNLWQARENDCFVEWYTEDQNIEVFVRPVEFATRTTGDEYWRITAVGVSLVDLKGQTLATQVRHIPDAINL